MTQLPIDLPPTEDELFGRTTCGNPDCNNPPMRISNAMIDPASGEHFCNDACFDYTEEVYPQLLGRTP